MAVGLAGNNPSIKVVTSQVVIGDLGIVREVVSDSYVRPKDQWNQG
jgi:hypothetical protein